MQTIIQRLSKNRKTAEIQYIQPCAACAVYIRMFTRCLQVAYKENYKIAPEVFFPGLSLVFQLFPNQILEIFQKGDELYLDFGTDYLRIFMGCTFLNGICILVSNFFPSIGWAKAGIVVALSRQVIFQLPLILVFPLIWGLNGVLYAGPVADTLTALLCVILARKAIKELDQKSNG